MLAATIATMQSFRSIQVGFLIKYFYFAAMEPLIEKNSNELQDAPKSVIVREYFPFSSFLRKQKIIFLIGESLMRRNEQDGLLMAK